jgi:hypothetical protein
VNYGRLAGDLRGFVTDPGEKPSTGANEIHKHLEDQLVNNRSISNPMKKTHVFLFDEAQVLLESHYDFQAFLFRCVRTCLRKRRGNTTTIGVFSGTSSAILNYTIQTDFLKDSELQKVPPSRGLKDNKDFYSRGLRTFEPFFTLTTMAVLKPTKEIPNQSDYDKSIHLGRPLFVIMYENKVLEEKTETILRRLLLDTGREGFDWTKHTESWFSVLATRVQMGATNVNLASNLVAKGYANLTGVTNNTASFTYMPDPVCGRLAMCMMDENWRLESLKGKDKKWWCAAFNTLYSTGLCVPDKGDMGEVLTVLYLLFCTDECRQSIHDNKDYKKFSVPLEDWIDSLISEDADATIEKQSSFDSPGKPKSEPSKIFVNFIQVCRDYIRAPWMGFANQVYLKNQYDSGTAFYTYPRCELIDFWAPTVITGTTGKTKPTYSAVLVSIKSRLYFPPGEATKLCTKMKKKADKSGMKSALCIVCIFGQTSKSKYKEFNYDAAKMTELKEGKNVAIVLHVPKSDRFGVTDIFLDMTETQARSEILSSHTSLRTWGQKLQAEDALRQRKGSKRPEVDFYKKIMNDLYPQKENQE